jgi:hypothetical protein
MLESVRDKHHEAEEEAGLASDVYSITALGLSHSIAHVPTVAVMSAEICGLSLLMFAQYTRLRLPTD